MECAALKTVGTTQCNTPHTARSVMIEVRSKALCSSMYERMPPPWIALPRACCDRRGAEPTTEGVINKACGWD